MRVLHRSTSHGVSVGEHHAGRMVMHVVLPRMGLATVWEHHGVALVMHGIMVHLSLRENHGVVSLWIMGWRWCTDV